MMAVTVDRAFAFPLRDSWVPCGERGARHKDEKQIKCHSCWQFPASDGMTECCFLAQAGLQHSQMIYEQIFPLGLCLTDVQGDRSGVMWQRR